LVWFTGEVCLYYTDKSESLLLLGESAASGLSGFFELDYLFVSKFISTLPNLDTLYCYCNKMGTVYSFSTNLRSYFCKTKFGEETYFGDLFLE
jgi:hypothetical protein